jgi:hypothetical protein
MIPSDMKFPAATICAEFSIMPELTVNRRIRIRGKRCFVTWKNCAMDGEVAKATDLVNQAVL